jgi:hypothetical protein
MRASPGVESAFGFRRIVANPGETTKRSKKQKRRSEPTIAIKCSESTIAINSNPAGISLYAR